MKKNFIGLSTITAFWIPTASLTLSFLAGIINPVFAKPETIDLTYKTVVEDEVTLRVRVMEENRRPSLNLEQEKFTVLVDGKPVNDIKVTPPSRTEPTPARVLFLVDLSGSMKRKDESGATKLNSAIEAIEAYIKAASQRGGDIKIAILPFAKGSARCPSHVVDETTIAGKGFKALDDVVLQQSLDYLKNLNPSKLCASTNLYDPLYNSIEYFANTNNTDFYPHQTPENQKIIAQNPNDPKLPREPQLSVILLSDGFHNDGNEADEFENLETILDDNPKIVVHTLGYGLTPKGLAKKVGKSKVTRADISYKKPVPSGKISAEEFVDHDRLEQIASITNGIGEFTNNSRKVSAALIDFFNALGEYEITYKTPNAEEGKFYQVEVELTDEGNIVDQSSVNNSNTDKYKVIWNPLEGTQRFAIFAVSGVTLLLAGGLWLVAGKKIREDNI